MTIWQAKKCFALHWCALASKKKYKRIRRWFQLLKSRIVLAKFHLYFFFKA